MILDSKLNFEEHFKTISTKVNKTIGLFRKLQKTLSQQPLLTIYKSFIRPRLEYGDVIFNQSYNVSFLQKLETFPYNAALTITGAIRGTSREKLFNKLGIKLLQNRRWYRKVSCLSEIITNQSPIYLFNQTPRINTARSTQSCKNIPLLSAKHNLFLNTFFLTSH